MLIEIIFSSFNFGCRGDMIRLIWVGVAVAS